MTLPLFLGLDVGTQGTKGIVVDGERGVVVARAACGYDLIPGLPAGAAEQHPQTWLDAIAAVVAELRESSEVDPRRIGGIGVSGQQHGLVVLDDADRVLRPAKLWCDTATAPEAADLSRRLGRAVPCGFTAPKILWLARHEPENWRRTRSVLLPHDYVNFWLTGEKTMEAGDASGTGFFDPVMRRFDAAAMAAIDGGLSAKLPALADAGAAAGYLRPAAAETLGLAPGIPVAAGGGDNMMSALGSGATCSGVVVISLGTSGTVFAFSERPVVDPRGEIAGFCDSTGGWLPLLCVMNVTGVTEEIRASFAPTENLASLTRAAESVPAGADGLLLLPYLQGERVPDLPHATGALLGMRPGTIRPGHLFRAALEGTSLSLAVGVERLEELGVATGDVRLVGGGARNPLWCRILTDVLQKPVSLLCEADSAALGAAIAAVWTVRRLAGDAVDAASVAKPFVRIERDVVAPNPKHAGLYAGMRGRLKDATERIFGGIAGAPAC